MLFGEKAIVVDVRAEADEAIFGTVDIGVITVLGFASCGRRCGGL